MQIEVTGRHPGITQHVREYATDKARRLERYFDGTKRVEIVMSREGDQSVAELILSASGRRIASEARQPDLYAAIDFVVDKAEKQLIRYKEKLKEHRAKPGGAKEQEEQGEEAQDV